MGAQKFAESSEDFRVDDSASQLYYKLLCFFTLTSEPACASAFIRLLLLIPPIPYFTMAHVIKRNTIPHKFSTGSRGSNETQAAVKVTFNDDPTSAEPRLYTGQLYEQLPSQIRSKTQTQQDHDDEAAKKKAMKELVQSWMDRLQLISLITTFFASVESTLIGSAVSDDPSKASVSLKVAQASLMGALVMHASAAVISFLAAFLLIRFKLTEAKNQEAKVTITDFVQSPVDLEKNDSSEGIANGHDRQSSARNPKVPQSHPTEPPLFSSDPHLETVGLFRAQPQTHLLSRCHGLCIWLAAGGFSLALVGIVAMSWSLMPQSVAVFTSTCMVVCLGGSAVVFIRV
ncbi:hypothetical protein JAAARDRAFT_39818 [Jaapia argillacea MUCL 33604]|uniref:Transmembrane protein n=1 Tax=Jaapia argillacea MUCL 33604 TaxID=933084 RepID=A0A067PNG2_9AGAM|nr:hypothetical protein JAAARDRAFT_39818 [Jaapia argillacea MUCL 33604]